MKNIFDTYQGAKTIQVETDGWTLEN